MKNGGLLMPTKLCVAFENNVHGQDSGGRICYLKKGQEADFGSFVLQGSEKWGSRRLTCLEFCRGIWPAEAALGRIVEKEKN